MIVVGEDVIFLSGDRVCKTPTQVPFSIISPYLHFCTQELLIITKSFLHEMHVSSLHLEQLGYICEQFMQSVFVLALVFLSSQILKQFPFFLKKPDLQLEQVLLFVHAVHPFINFLQFKHIWFSSAI